MFDMRHIEVSVVARPGNTRAMERYRQELWPTKSRYERIFGVAAIVALLAGWFTDFVILRTSTLSFVLLGLRALQAGCVVPMLIGAHRRERPP